MQITFSTNIGKQRQNNEDNGGVYYNMVDIPLCLVADGMGGHRAGDIASELAVKYLGSTWQLSSLDTATAIKEWLTSEIQIANDRVVEKAAIYSEYKGMGTTLVTATVLANEILFSNIGDSRAYLLRDKEYRQLTEDHSLVNELVKRGEIAEEEAEHHPRKNILTRSLGVPQDIEVDVFRQDIQLGDIFLLCSDGLSNMISNDEAKQILLARDSVERKAARLIEAANKNGGNDNITVLLIAVTE